ncbi:hypothetical protein QYZ87_03635 [Porphyromonadaceae bacterium W3.11]|nr:hypothetical protein [Porphyromonadaceae bacterium W3.11]
MDEVSIDIRLNSNVEEEAGKATSAIQEMAQGALDAQAKLKATMDFRKKLINELKNAIIEINDQIQALSSKNKDWGLTKDGKFYKQELASVNKEIELQEKALAAESKELEKLINGYGLIATQIRKTKAEMATLSAAGKQNSETYRKLERDLQELAEAQAMVNRTGQELAKGNRSWQGLADAVSAFSGAASAATGAWTLLGGSQEDQAAIQTKLQSLMAITIGLQQVQNVLLETSTFRIQTVTKVKRFWTTANTKLAASLGMSAAAAKALTATITLGLSVAIGFLISAYDKWQSKQKAIREEQERFASSVSNKVGDVIATYKRLQQEFVALNGNLKKQKEFVQKNAEAFKQMGVKVDDVRSAENLLVDNTDAFVKSVMIRAKAAASMELASEKYKESIQKMMQAEQRAANPTGMDSWFAFEENVRQFTLGLGWGDTDGGYIAKLRSRDIADDARKDREAGDLLIQNSLNFEKEYKEIWDNIGVVPIDTISKSSKSTENAYKKMSDRLAQIAKANEEELLAIELAALKEGREKKLRELEIENEKRKALLKERQRELEEIAKAGIDTTAQQAKLKLVSDNGDAEYLRKVAEANAASDRIIQEVEATLDAKVATRQEQRIAQTKREYDEWRKEAEAHVRDKEELADILVRIATEEQAELSRIRKEGELDRIDFEEMIALRRIQISNKRYNLETEREEELLETELAFAQKRQAKLQEMQANGADVGKEIEEVTERIKDLTDALEDIPVRKLEEMGRGLQSIFGSLSKLGGEIGETFSSLAESVGIAVSGIKSKLSIDKVSAAISGIMQVADVAIQQAKENREFMKAWQEANESALQVARMQRIEAAGYKEGNIFGVENPYARAIAGAKQYAKTMYELQALSRTLANGQVQVGSKKVVSGSNVAKGAAGGAAAGGVVGSIFGPIGTAIGAGIGALIGGIFGGSKKKLVPVFESLGKKYKEIYDKDTFALNPEILQDYAKLDDATKKLVDNWDAIQKKAQEAEQQMRDNFRSLSGDIGSQLSEALKKGIADGDIYAAFDDFKSYASKVIYDIGEQMIFAQFFQESFDELQKRMEDSFGAGGDGDIRDDIRWLVDSARGNIEGYKDAMDAFRSELEKQGMQLPDVDAGRKAEARGIGRMTQDSAERLEGLMTVQVDRLSTLVTYAKQTDDYQRDARVYFATMIRQIDRIASNSDYLRKLDNIATDMYRVAQDGVYLKK